jgi:hypothetical protein
MTPRLTWPGTVAYALVTVTLVVQTVRMIRLDGVWGGDATWAAGCLLVIVLLSGAIFAAATVTRIPLFADDGPLLSRFGWYAILGLTVLALAVVMLSSLEAFGLWPTSPAMFVPYWIRRLEDSYREGVEEARRAAATARADDEPPPAAPAAHDKPLI